MQIWNRAISIYIFLENIGKKIWKWVKLYQMFMLAVKVSGITLCYLVL